MYKRQPLAEKCKTPLNIIIFNNHSTKKKHYLEIPSLINLHNDCKHFISKWFKILKYKRAIKKWMKNYEKIRD